MIEKDPEDALLEFHGADTTTIAKLTVIYTYDTNQHCTEKDPLYNDFIKGGYWEWICSGTITTITNEGDLIMNDIMTDMNIIYPQNMTHDHNEFVYDWGISGHFILNKGTLHISNVHIREVPNFGFIVADNGITSIFNLSFDSEYISNYNPNHLHARMLVASGGQYSHLRIEDSYFYGSEYQLQGHSGFAEIYNSSCEMSIIPILFYAASQVEISDCNITKMGRHYGPFLHFEETSYWAESGIQFIETNNIRFYNNYVSGFDPDGFMAFWTCSNVEFIGNRFVINTEDMAYNVTNTSQSLTFYERPFIIAFDEDTANTTLIYNHFDHNSVDPTAHWIGYLNGYGQNCLSGNIFSNAAIHVVNTNLTSCFRPKLVEYVRGNNPLKIYGPMNVSLYDAMGLFIIDKNANVSSVISATSSDIAFDNVKFGGNDTIRIQLNESYMLLLESYISKKDDMRFDTNCDIFVNQRLSDNHDFISKLKVYCDVIGDNELTKSINNIDSSNITYSNSTSAFAVNASIESNTYYPGQLLSINYDVIDRFNNIIPFDFIGNVEIELSGDSFLAVIAIGSNQDILINAVTIFGHIGNEYVIHLFVKNGILHSFNNNFILNIVGCPIGSEPDDNNASCINCDTNSYKLSNYDIEECKSCNPYQENSGIHCVDGGIIISYNHWIGFDENSNMIAAVCPLTMCCQKHNGCNYINSDDEGKLCAFNRDSLSILCSKCLDGFSEAINNSNCVKCQQKFHFEYLLIPMVYSLFVTMIILYISMDWKEFKPKLEKKTVKGLFKAIIYNRNIRSNLKVMIFKNIVYYQQAVSQIIATSPYKIIIETISAPFNLSLISMMHNNNTSASWCFIDGLTAKGKVLIDLFIPAMVILMVSTICFISKFVLKRDISSKTRKVSFSKAIISTYLIVIGKILDVIFRIMSCKQIGNDTFIHWYFGEEICYKTSWWIAFVILLLIIITFCIIFIKLKLMSCSDRENRENILNRFVSKYKPQYYYWEIIIFFRRIIIALFAVSSQNINIEYIFLLILILFIYLHYECNPFESNYCNRMEYILLISLIFVVSTRIGYYGNNEMNEIMINSLISLLIILPFPLLFYFVNSLYKQNVLKNEKAEQNANNEQVPKLDDQDSYIKMEQNKETIKRSQPDFVTNTDGLHAIKDENNMRPTLFSVGSNSVISVKVDVETEKTEIEMYKTYKSNAVKIN